MIASAVARFTPSSRTIPLQSIRVGRERVRATVPRLLATSLKILDVGRYQTEHRLHEARLWHIVVARDLELRVLSAKALVILTSHLQVSRIGDRLS